MKKKTLLVTGMAFLLVLGIGLVGLGYSLLSPLKAADHVDAPNVRGLAQDIADFYVFDPSDGSGDTIVFVCTLQGLLSPNATPDAAFEPGLMIEFNIDNADPSDPLTASARDNVEDLVIQCTFKDGKMIVYGPARPLQTGTKSTLLDGALKTEVLISQYKGNVNVGTTTVPGGVGTITAFAGPRDDPFFFDFARFNTIKSTHEAGTASSWNSTGTDNFAGTNVLAIVIEVPKDLVKGADDKFNAWVEAKLKDS